MKKIILLSILFIVSLGSCTIEKRKYSSGYHTTWNVQKFSPKANKEITIERISAAKILKKEESELKGIPEDELLIQEEIKIQKTAEIETYKKEKIALHPSKSAINNNKVLSDSLSPQSAIIAENYLWHVKKYQKAKLHTLISFVVGAAGLFVALDADVGFAYVAIFVGYFGLIVFGIITLISLIQKIIAFNNLRKSILDSKETSIGDSNTREKLVHQFKLADLEEMTKYNKWKTLSLGIIAIITGIVDLFEIGALGYLISPIPLVFFGVSLLFFFILRSRKSNLNSNLKKSII